jgi:hypothetical protein
MMRTHPAYTRVRDMLSVPEIPRTAQGGIALCHICQRSLYFAGGFLELLTERLRRIAKSVKSKSNANVTILPGMRKS